MDLAKSLFENRNHEGYVGKDAHTKRELALAIEPDDMEDNLVENFSEGLNVNDALTPTPGGPFSALTPSMWPQDIMAKQSVIPDDPNSQPEYRFDEFGFRVDEEDGPEQNSNKLLGIPFVEDPQHRLQWVAHLEFSHNKEVSDLTWDKVEVRLPRTDKLLTMVKSGIPHSLRPQMWMRMSGALEKKQQSELCYKEIVKMSSNDSLMTSKQIEKDLLHTMPTNACYSHINSTGIPRLRRILRGLAWLYPDIGYCQGTGMIAASLLLFMEEENAFWIMVTIVEDLLPASYYSSTLLGIQADQRVLRTLIVNYLPEIDETLKNHDIELSLITLHWFLTLFASVVHMKILLRIWDLFFFEGSIVLFQITLSMLKMKEPRLRELENSAQIFNALSDIPGDIDDVDKLLEISTELTSSLNEVMIETYRRRHLAYLMADQGALVGNPEAAPNLPKQHLASCYNNDLIQIDQNFAKFLTWLQEQTAKQFRCHDIQQIVGPLFCHLYMDILRGGPSERASSFFKSHLPAIDKTKCDDNVKELIDLLASDNDTTKVKETFRSKKVIAEVSRESLAVLKKFVLENCHVVFLQVLQTWFDFHESNDHSNTAKKDKEMISADPPKDHKYHDLLSAIRNLKRKPVPLYNIKISNYKQAITCGLLKRQCGLVAFAEHNILRLMPVHCLNSLFNLDINTEQIILTNHSDQIYSIAISPNNNILVSASADHSICIYNLEYMSLVRKCMGHSGPVYCVKISSNGEYVVSGSMDATARLWDIKTGRILRVFAGHTQPITCLDFHPNCLYVVTGSADKNIRLWSLNKATPLRLFHAAKSIVYSLSFNPSGKLLASSSEDKKIRVWELLTSKIVAELRCKDSIIVRLVWNKDGRELCAGTCDGVIRVWDFASIQNHWENSKNHEPILTQVLNSKLLSLEYTFGSYGTLTV